MKKFRYPIAMFSLLSAFLVLTSCNKDEVEDQVEPAPENLIIGKWTMHAAIADHVDYGVNYQDTTLFTTDDYFEFKPDGTVSIMATGVSYAGNWNITNGTLTFTNTGYVDFTGGFSVLTLTQSDLKLNHTQNNPPDHYLDAKLNFKR